jgi:hypothetical protein
MAALEAFEGMKLLAEARRQASRLLAAPADEGERHKTQSQHRPG